MCRLNDFQGLLILIFTQLAFKAHDSEIFEAETGRSAVILLSKMAACHGHRDPCNQDKPGQNGQWRDHPCGVGCVCWRGLDAGCDEQGQALSLFFALTRAFHSSMLTSLTVARATKESVAFCSLIALANGMIRSCLTNSLRRVSGRTPRRMACLLSTSPSPRD